MRIYYYLNHVFQDKPPHQYQIIVLLSYLDYNLKKKHAENALESIQLVFTRHILQDDKKLDSFQKSLELKTDIPDFELVDAYYEHCIKEIYRDFVTNILWNMLKDDLENYRK